MLNRKTPSERTKSALGLGLIFILIISPLYIIPSDTASTLRAVIGAYSPIYFWRFWNCQHDPVWLLNLEGAIPFFLYGAVIGYFLNRKPAPNLKYVAIAAICFTVTIGVVLSVPDHPPNPACEVR